MPWLVKDRYENEIVLTEERWRHITGTRIFCRH